MQRGSFQLPSLACLVLVTSYSFDFFSLLFAVSSSCASFRLCARDGPSRQAPPKVASYRQRAPWVAHVDSERPPTR